MSSLLLIDEDGVLVRRENEHFVVTEKAIDLLRVPYVDVDCIVMAGSQEITRGALDLALSREIPVFLMTRSGQLRGSLSSPICAGAETRSCQYRMTENEDSRLYIAQQLVGAQLRNQRALLRRLALRRSSSETLLAARQDIKMLLKSVSTRTAIADLRGVEGRASRLVFDGIRSILDPKLGFTTRAIRSDRDPFNCVLDVCGGLLATTCKGAIEAAKLDPYWGIFHGSSHNGPALALDLEDVYRPLLVTATAVTLFTKKVLKQDSFIITNKSCNLTTEGFAKTCRIYGANLRRSVLGVNQTQAKTYLHHIHQDARQLASYFRGSHSDIEFFTVR